MPLPIEERWFSSDAWNSPVRSHSNETPFSPVMFGYKHVALEKIAEHLKELALEISSTDVRSRIDARLSSLQRDFLLPQSEQLKISEIQSLLSDPTSDKAVIASRIQELAGNLLSIPQTAISPRPNRLPSWGEANETDFSLSNLSLRQPSF